MASGTGWLVVGAGVLALSGAYLLTRPQSGGCGQGGLPIQLVANGPGTLCASGDCTRSRLTICPPAGSAVEYQATPDAGHSFRLFDGPGGVTTTQNPFSVTTQMAGFVRATFV